MPKLRMTSVSVVTMAMTGVLALASCGGGGKGGGSKTPKAATTPTAFFESYKQASLAGDTDAVWAMLTKGTQDKQRNQLEKLRAMEGIPEMLGISAEELAAMPPEKLLHVFMTKQLEQTHDKVAGTVIDHVEEQGPDRAIVHTTDPDGKKTRGVLVREGGAWKLDIVATEALENEGKDDDVADKRPVG